MKGSFPMIDLSLDLPNIDNKDKCYAVHKGYDYQRYGIPNNRPNHLVALFDGDWREISVEIDIENIIIHETIHIVLFTLEGEEVGCNYDNIWEQVRYWKD